LPFGSTGHTIEYIEKENLADHAKELGHYSVKGMREMMDRHPLVGDLRGLGLFLGI